MPVSQVRRLQAGLFGALPQARLLSPSNPSSAPPVAKLSQRLHHPPCSRAPLSPHLQPILSLPQQVTRPHRGLASHLSLDGCWGLRTTDQPLLLPPPTAYSP